MAFPHPQGLLPSEVAFLCEMESIGIIPRQRLERLDLLGGPAQPLIPPQRASLPLWLALLLKRQKRANIQPPPWLHPDSLRDILELETIHYQDSFSPAPQLPTTTSTATTSRDRDAIPTRTRLDFQGKPFYTSPPFTGNMLPSAPANALPYHWFELAEMLLDSAADDLVDPDTIRGLLRDLREVRLAKMRKGVDVLSGEGEGIRLDGVGAMEVSESRGFVTGVMDGLRRIGASKEQARREREEEEGGRYSGAGGRDDDDEDEDMS